MNLICSECKNSVDVSTHPDLKVGDVVECTMCGITLEVTSIGDDGVVNSEVADEGK